MSRLYDRLWRHGCQPMCDQKNARELSQLVYGWMAHSPVVVDASNVAGYWAKELGASSANAKECPNVAPPWEDFFVEYAFPAEHALPDCGAVEFLKDARGLMRERASGMDRHPLFGLPTRVGVMFAATDLEENPEKKIDLAEFLRDTDGGSFDLDTTRFWINVMVVCEYGKGRILGPLFRVVLPVEESGEVARDRTGGRAMAFSVFLHGFGDKNAVSDHVYEPFCMLGKWYVTPALVALSLLHCRNVSINTHEPNSKASDKHRKNYGAPLTKYRTLAIEPMTRLISGESAGAQDKMEHAFHICRGHFARYSDDKPLFGRYSGTFWKPMHVRGSKSKGEVVKDYKIKEPK